MFIGLKVHMSNNYIPFSVQAIVVKDGCGGTIQPVQLALKKRWTLNDDGDDDGDDDS